MTEEGFIKLNRGSKIEELLELSLPAWGLLTLIALRARRYSGGEDGLDVGDAHIGDHNACNLTRRQYRTALQRLIDKKLIKIKETCRNRKKSPTGVATRKATVGTLVTLLDSSILDINCKTKGHRSGHRSGHRAATDRPPTGHEQEGRRKEDMIDMIDRAGARIEKNQSDKIYFRTTSTENPFEGIDRNVLYDSLKQKSFTEPEIDDAVKASRESQCTIRPGCIENYLAAVIKNNRKKYNTHERTHVAKPKKSRELPAKNLSGTFIRWGDINIACPAEGDAQGN